MTLRFEPRQIFSRVLAIFFLSFPLGYAMHADEQQTRAAIVTMSHAELLNFVTADYINSVNISIGVLFAVCLLYVAAIEGLAFVLRWAWAQVR